MSAYIVFIRERVRDQAGMEVYSPLAGASLAGHAAKPLSVYGAHETLEGAPIAGTVMLEFPTAADARAWYDSPAYVEARAHRFASADYRVFITEGM